MTIISISGVIGWDVTPDDVRAQLKKAKGDIMVEIGSPGGFVFDGLEIFNILRDYTDGKVTTKLMGIAASMASYIALAGEKVTAHDNAIYMIHNAMSIAIGNQNDMEEMRDHLEKLSNHLAKAYVKKSRKSLKEIKSMMDDETWLYGEEMKEAGFVDEIIETDDKKDKDSALIEANAKFQNCINTMKELENSKEDLKKAAAIIGPINSTPAVPEKSKIEEGKNMLTLNEFLAENAEAAAEYKKNIEEARKKGEEKIKAYIENAKNFLNNEKYPKVIAETALKVITEEIELTVLTAAVAAVDAVAEQAADNAATAETGKNGETPGQPAKKINDSGVCETEEDLQNEIARTKELDGGK